MSDNPLFKAFHDAARDLMTPINVSDQEEARKRITTFVAQTADFQTVMDAVKPTFRKIVESDSLYAVELIKTLARRSEQRASSFLSDLIGDHYPLLQEKFSDAESRSILHRLGDELEKIDNQRGLKAVRYATTLIDDLVAGRNHKPKTPQQAAKKKRLRPSRGPK